MIQDVTVQNYSVMGTSAKDSSDFSSTNFTSIIEEIKGLHKKVTAYKKEVSDELIAEFKKLTSGITICNKCGSMYMGTEIIICVKCGNNIEEQNKGKQIDEENSQVQSTDTDDVNNPNTAVQKISSNIIKSGQGK